MFKDALLYAALNIQLRGRVMIFSKFILLQYSYATCKVKELLVILPVHTDSGVILFEADSDPGTSHTCTIPLYLDLEVLYM